MKNTRFSPYVASLIPPQKSNFFLKSSPISTRKILTALFLLAAEIRPQFHILRKLSQDPVQTAMPSEDTPMQLTLLSWPARTPGGPQHIRKTFYRFSINSETNEDLDVLKTFLSRFNASIFRRYSPTLSDFSVSQMLTLKSS